MHHDAHSLSPHPPLHVLLAGGGTGGHVFPALTLADELRDRGWQVSFTGSATGPEARWVPGYGLPFYPLSARPVVGQGLVGKARAALTLVGSAVTARGLVRRLGVGVVLGTGGYVSAPAVIGARLARRPVMLFEPNAVSGVANRQLARFARAAAVAYEHTRSELSCDAEVTGIPVRRPFHEVADLEAPRDGAPTRLLILGGSQGALQLNRLLPEAVAQAARGLGRLEVLHQTGQRHLEATRAAYAAVTEEPGSSVTGLRVEVTPFLDDVAGAMARAQLVVSRAGAITLAELCAAGRPSLLIPLSLALGHQRDNARTLVEAGAAELLQDEADLTAAALVAALAARLSDLLRDADRLTSMARAARGLARPDAAARIADRLAALASKPLAGRAA